MSFQSQITTDKTIKLEIFSAPRLVSYPWTNMAHSLHFFMLIRELFPKMGIRQCQSNQNHNYNLQNLFVIIIFAHMFVASMAFLLTESNSIEEYGESFYVTATSLLLLVMWPCFVHNVNDLYDSMDQMDEFGQKRDASISKFMHGKMNERIEHVTKLAYFYHCKVYIAFGVSSAFIQTAVNYYIGGKGNDAFYLPVPIVLPFDWKTPLGYVLATVFVAISGFYCQIFFSLILCFHVGFCWLIVSFMADITNDLNALTHDCGHSDKRIAEIVYETVNLYSELRHMVVKFNQVYEFVPTVFILWCLSTICVALVLITMEFENSENFANAVNTLIRVSVLLGIIFLLSEFGQMVNNQFEAFLEKLCQCVWYTFPLKTQQIFRAFMMYSQDPVIIHGFGNTEFTRETFKRVIHASCSYFMVLRQLKE